MLIQKRNAWVLWILALAICPSVLLAQAANNAAQVNLGLDEGGPGAEIRIPIILNAPGRDVVSTISSVNFPSNMLTFVRTEASGSDAEKAKEEVSSDLDSSTRNDEKRLEVRIKSLDKTSLPDGSLAMIVFKISAKAAAGSAITLKNSSRVVTKSSQEVAVKGRNGTITVLEAPAPAVSCFFFSH